jgi:hypothetical protein
MKKEWTTPEIEKLICSETESGAVGPIEFTTVLPGYKSGS